MARILVVDDEEGVRTFVAEALEMSGHDVEQAPDGLAGAKILTQRAFEVLITDLKMPGLDGLGLLRTARARQPELQVIVLTAHGTVTGAVDAMKEGAFDYLQKPIGSPAELRVLVERAMERRSLLTLADRSVLDRADDPPLSYGDPVMAPVVRALERVAPTHATVLILGESGTGKEVAARAVHRLSRRSDGPFVSINCAALSESLLESELFGHEKGAFTGASARRRGRIELADGGTFFLDEVGEMKPDLQAKLLRVLEERRFERVGGSLTLEVDVRWVAATNRDLRAMVAIGTFREDLFHRLAVFPVQLPPLRERREDLAPLADTLLRRVAEGLGRTQLRLADDAREWIVAQRWPGNARELRNALERAAILADSDVLTRDLFDAAPPTREPAFEASVDNLAEIERQAIIRALASVGGHRKRAAEILGIGLRTLYDKLKLYDVG